MSARPRPRREDRKAALGMASVSAAAASTGHAGSQGGIEFQAPQRDRFAAGHAVAVVNRLETLQAGLAALHLDPAAPPGLQGDGLVLQGVPSGTSAPSCLIDRDAASALPAPRSTDFAHQPRRAISRARTSGRPKT